MYPKKTKHASEWLMKLMFLEGSEFALIIQFGYNYILIKCCTWSHWTKCWISLTCQATSVEGMDRHFDTKWCCDCTHQWDERKHRKFVQLPRKNKELQMLDNTHLSHDASSPKRNDKWKEVEKWQVWGVALYYIKPGRIYTIMVDPWRGFQSRVI